MDITEYNISFETIIREIKKIHGLKYNPTPFGNAPHDTIARLYQYFSPEEKPSRKGRVGKQIGRKVINQSFEHDWLDHFSADGNKFISEPYNLSLETAKTLINFCEENNLTFNITGASWHFPGWTLRITIIKKDQGDLNG